MAQEATFLALADVELATVPVPGLHSELVAALLNALTAYCSAGGTDLPTPLEIAEAYPAYPAIAPAYREAVQMAILTGVCSLTTAELALAGDLG